MSIYLTDARAQWAWYGYQVDKKVFLRPTVAHRKVSRATRDIGPVMRKHLTMLTNRE